MNPNQLNTQETIIKNCNVDEVINNDSGDESDSKPSRRSGRRKIKIEYIEDKNRRHITFSKRKAGIMKKAYELSTLTGTQVLLLVVSETGLVYTFTTVKLQPIVTKPEGKNLIQACLNAPDPTQEESNENDSTAANSENMNTTQSGSDIERKSGYEDSAVDSMSQAAALSPPSTATSTRYGSQPSTSPYQQQHPYGGVAPTSAAPSMPPLGATGNYGGPPPNYLNPTYRSPQQPQQQTPYGQLPGPNYYGGQQPQQHYMQHPSQGYWPNNASNSTFKQEDDKSRIK
ncbi:MAG: hypothetical protein EXX96DRAFT_553849 [Benjaminiella poitrasii]|nr:MAG: hypothetical protein EXX96DRAFT_553849 [Benjaminiella poitrasii]